MVSRIDDFCPKCGASAYEALNVPIGGPNRAYACRNCNALWGAVDDWAALEEYTHKAVPDDDLPDE